MGRAFFLTRRTLLAKAGLALAWTATGAGAAETGAAPQAAPTQTVPSQTAQSQAAPSAGASAEASVRSLPVSDAAAGLLAALPGKAIVGDAGATPFVTELVDYNAPQWRRSALDMEALLQEDPGLAYALVQTPRFDVRSFEAARISLAVLALAKDQARFLDFYLRLAKGSGSIDGPAALEAAREIGLDRFTVYNHSVAPENTQALTAAARFASAIKVLETPAYVVGGTAYLGSLDLAQKRALIAKSRACGGC